MIFTILYQNMHLLIEWYFERGNRYHRVHSNFSDEYGRKYIQTLFHKYIKRKHFTRGSVSSSQFLYQHGWQNSAGLEVLGRTFIPFSCLDIWWVYTDMTIERCLKMSKSEKKYNILRLLISMEFKTYILLINKYTFTSVQYHAW